MAREALTVAVVDNLITDEEFALLYDINHSSNLTLPTNHAPFNLQIMTNDECLHEFRVNKCDLPILATALRIPETFKLEQRSVVGGMEALCMLLRRLAYPCRYGDILHRFGGRTVPVMCLATNCVLAFIYQTHSHRITGGSNNPSVWF